jgi:hypothetical protein
VAHLRRRRVTAPTCTQLGPSHCAASTPQPSSAPPGRFAGGLLAVPCPPGGRRTRDQPHRQTRSRPLPQRGGQHIPVPHNMVALRLAAAVMANGSLVRAQNFTIASPITHRGSTPVLHPASPSACGRCGLSNHRNRHLYAQLATHSRCPDCPPEAETHLPHPNDGEEPSARSLMAAGEGEMGLMAEPPATHRSVPYYPTIACRASEPATRARFSPGIKDLTFAAKRSIIGQLQMIRICS